MNEPRKDKDFFFSKGPHLEPFSRILLAFAGVYFFLFTSSKAFSQAPLLVFLVGCAFTYAGLNGLRFSGFSFSKDSFMLERYQIPDSSPISPDELHDGKPEASGDSSDLGDRSLTPVNINWSIKQGIAGIATTASGETTRADEIKEVYAIGNDVSHLFVLTTNGRALSLDFAQASGATSGVGIQ
jgi:hypothetical protein